MLYTIIWAIIIGSSVLTNAEVKLGIIQYVSKPEKENSTILQKPNLKLPLQDLISPNVSLIFNSTFNSSQSDISKSSKYQTVILDRLDLEKSQGSNTTTVEKVAKEILKAPSIEVEQEKPGMEDIEETITYQVKRQTRSSHFNYQKELLEKPNWINSFFKSSNKIPRLSEDKSFADVEKMENTQMKKINELETKVASLLEYLSNLEGEQKDASTKVNATMTLLKENIHLLNASHEHNSNVSTELGNNLTLHKEQALGQIYSLSAHLRNTQTTASGQYTNFTKRMEQIASVMQNASHEIRMNEVRTRYNQKALTTLDKQFQTQHDKVNEMASLVGQRWEEQTTGCGGLLVADAGIISYKFRQPYLNNERCIWTVRVNRRSKIVLQLLEDGFQNSSNSDFITVTEFLDDHPTSLITSSRIETGNRAIHTFRGPLIFISFYSDSIIPGNGFTLKFQGAQNSSLAEEINAIRYRHFHLKEAIGQMTYPDGKHVIYQPNELVTFVINPSSSTTIKFHLRYSDLEKEESCEYDSVSFYGSVMASYALAKKYCEQEEVFNGESLQSTDGTFIILFRSDASTQFKGFQFSWETL